MQCKVKVFICMSRLSIDINLERTVEECCNWIQEKYTLLFVRLAYALNGKLDITRRN